MFIFLVECLVYKTLLTWKETVLWYQLFSKRFCKGILINYKTVHKVWNRHFQNMWGTQHFESWEIGILGWRRISNLHTACLIGIHNDSRPDICPLQNYLNSRFGYRSHVKYGLRRKHIDIRLWFNVDTIQERPVRLVNVIRWLKLANFVLKSFPCNRSWMYRNVCDYPF